MIGHTLIQDQNNDWHQKETKEEENQRPTGGAGLKKEERKQDRNHGTK